MPELHLNSIYLGDAKSVLSGFPDKSIDCCITSPPYYGLRDYGVDGQLGLEKTPEEFIENLVAVFREVGRVLKDTGTLWVVIGDSYAGGSGRWGGMKNLSKFQRSNIGSLTQIKNSQPWKHPVIKPKDLIGIPWALAFALRAEGWWLRQDIIWEKGNCQPSSIKDRCTTSHEYVFMFSKKPKYYYDIDAIREPHTTLADLNRRIKNGKEEWKTVKAAAGSPFAMSGTGKSRRKNYHPLGRNKRTVWHVNLTKTKEAHFATYPEGLIVDCIKAGCPVGGVVLDPFVGSGTTPVVALKNNRKYIGIELNPEYIEIVKRRLAKVDDI